MLYWVGSLRICSRVALSTTVSSTSMPLRLHSTPLVSGTQVALPPKASRIRAMGTRVRPLSATGTTLSLAVSMVVVSLPMTHQGLLIFRATTWVGDAARAAGAREISKARDRSRDRIRFFMALFLSSSSV